MRNRVVERSRGAGPGAQRASPRSERECRLLAERRARRGYDRQVEVGEHACGGIPLDHRRDGAQWTSAAGADQVER